MVFKPLKKTSHKCPNCGELNHPRDILESENRILVHCKKCHLDYSSSLSGTIRFQQFCSNIMHEYEKRGKWSTSELAVKAILKELGFKEKIHYLHNFKLQNRKQTGYFSLDFFFPHLKLVLECSPSIWHSRMGNADKKDTRRKRWLETLGFNVITLKEDILSSPEKLRKFLKDVFQR